MDQDDRWHPKQKFDKCNHDSSAVVAFVRQKLVVSLDAALCRGGPYFEPALVLEKYEFDSEVKSV